MFYGKDNPYNYCGHNKITVFNCIFHFKTVYFSLRGYKWEFKLR